MCLIVFSWQENKQYPLILLGNRDEFYQRPTAPADYWEGKDDHILAGKDLQAGGTWLGMNKQGKFTTITNYRDLLNIKENAPSRGDLTAEYLRSDLGPGDYLKSIHSSIDQYNGFNLLVGTPEELWYLNNVDGNIQQLKPGIYGLSNAVLDTEWPKTKAAKEKFTTAIQGGASAPEELLPLLYDTTTADDKELPKTGVPLEWERKLSAMFIQSEDYGTSITSLLKIDREQKLHFTEKTHAVGGRSEVLKQFSVKLSTN